LGAKRAVFLNTARARRHYISVYVRDIRQEEWASSIAAGSRPFVENAKTLLGFRAKGGDVPLPENAGHFVNKIIRMSKILTRIFIDK